MGRSLFIPGFSIQHDAFWTLLSQPPRTFTKIPITEQLGLEGADHTCWGPCPSLGPWPFFHSTLLCVLSVLSIPTMCIMLMPLGWTWVGGDSMPTTFSCYG
jgi:hypothetical protein